MNRPNRLDWLVYRVFRWWWNPILRSHPGLTFGLAAELAGDLVRRSPGWADPLHVAIALETAVSTGAAVGVTVRADPIDREPAT